LNSIKKKSIDDLIAAFPLGCRENRDYINSIGISDPKGIYKLEADTF
jgi:hypothetical protein